MWILYALLAAAIWGLVYVLDEQAFKFVTIPQFCLFSSVCGLLFWGGYFMLTGHSLGITEVTAHGPKIWGLLLLTTGICILGSFVIYTSISSSNATLAAMIETSYPLFTFLFAWLITKDVQVTPMAIAGFFVIMGGIALTYFGSTTVTETEKSTLLVNNANHVKVCIHPLASVNKSILAQQLHHSMGTNTSLNAEIKIAA